MRNTGNPNGTAPPKVAEQVVDMLAEAGVKNIYAITGDSLNGLTDAIGRDGRIRFIHMRHEESGAFAASAEAQLTGRLACCAGSSGPGHVHLINGLYDAQRSNAPVLAIASTCPSGVYGTGYFQETDPTLLFSNCSVYNQTAVTPQQVSNMMHTAMQEAVAKGGVGVVGLPADVLDKPSESSTTASKVFDTPRIPSASDDVISQCADLINGASKIAVYAGCGCAQAVDSLMAFAAKVNAPVATTFKSQLMLTRNCPNYVGHIGFLGMYSAIDAIHQADVIVMIGMNFPFPGNFPADKKIIQVDIRAERLGRIAQVDIGVHADAGQFLTALSDKTDVKTDRSFLDSMLQEYADIRQKLSEPIKNPGCRGNIRPEYMISLLDKLAAQDCIFTVDTGMNCLWSAHYLTPGTGRQMVGSFTHGSMANAMPMAIGAAISCPGRQIISISGDGGLAMLMGDMLTVVQYNLPVKILVADNRALAYVKWEMELAGFTPREVNLQNPDFGEMAHAMGFQAETVDDPSQLEAAMKRWLSCPGPALLSVVTQQDAASFAFSRTMMTNTAPDSPLENFIAPGSV